MEQNHIAAHYDEMQDSEAVAVEKKPRVKPAAELQIQIPPACLFVLERFAAAGKKAYLVGGCVRDSLLGTQPKDWDICTEATPEEMLEIFAGEKVIPTGLQHGTITLMKYHMPVEITTYRIDGAYEDNRHPKEVFFTRELREDLRRRDFTINAMAWHPEEGIIDYFDGIGDLERGIVRCVGNPVERYEEDGLRMMRGIRFASVLGFDLEEGTMRAIGACSHLLKNISRERIQVELDKIVSSDRADYGIDTLCCTGCMDYLIPELMDCRNFGQFGGLHEYDVYGHMIRSMMLVPADTGLRLTMLMHDIGKPQVWTEECGPADDLSDKAENGWETTDDAAGADPSQYGDIAILCKDGFPNHEVRSAELAEQILKRLKYDNKTIRRVTTLVGAHTRMLLPREDILRRAIRDYGPEGVRDLIAVKRADIWAHSSELANNPLEIFHEIEEMLDRILDRGDCCTLKQLAITGRDLTGMGYKGKEIGDILDRLLELVLENPSRNNREYLLRQVNEG